MTHGGGFPGIDELGSLAGSMDNVRLETSVKSPQEKLKSAAKLILEAIGEDSEREGLRGTPDRFARWWTEFINYDPGNTATSFESVTTDQLVLVTGMRVWSLCEHHLLPFWCDISIGYIAQDRVLGLSKLARVAHKHAHALQIQERLADLIANEVAGLAGSPHVGVIAQGRHLCMVMRGIKTDGLMTSSVLLGQFREDNQLRSEFLALATQPQVR